MQDVGFSHLQPPALALPIAPPDRAVLDLHDVMLKPDKPRLHKNGRPAKYEVRPNARNRIHVPLAVRDKLADVSIPLVITEGWKKAEKAAQEGICTVALAGSITGKTALANRVSRLVILTSSPWRADAFWFVLIRMRFPTSMYVEPNAT